MQQENDTSFKKTNRNNKLKRLVLCAIMIALATVLSIFPKIEAPLGGSITVASMVPIMLVSFVYGPKWGVPVAIGYSVVQLLLDIAKVASWGLTPGVFVGCLILDYILAFSVISVCGVFTLKKTTLPRVITGTLTAGLLRYLCHFISGYFFFGAWAEEGFSPLTWSIAYNGAYMLPDTAICIVVMLALYKLIPKFKEM
ncbi:MAG: energy-coupled thiamine transporter ThiT [Clostridia bacterium]|nr:energy-coupled thiamine transporter ThiT [Clostridia bacterium]